MNEIVVSAAGDWGYNSPGCIGWFLHLTDGHYHCAQEYKFQQMSVEDVAHEIHKRTRALEVKRLQYLVLDPACWQKTGHGKGESIAETMQRYGLPVRKGDHDRKNGWQRVHELFRLDKAGIPWLTFDPRCTYLRRSIPAAVSDKKDPDDVDTNIDDHALDMLRYWALSRPSPSRMKQTPTYSYMSLGWMKALDQKSEARRGVLRRSA